MLRQLVYKDSVKLSEEDDDDEDTDMATKYVFMTTFNQDRKGWAMVLWLSMFCWVKT